MTITLTTFLIGLATILFCSCMFTMIYTERFNSKIDFLFIELINLEAANERVWACNKKTGEWDFYDLNEYNIADLEIMDGYEITEEESEN